MLETLVTRNLAASADRPAVYIGAQVRTYAEMARDIDLWSAWIAQRGYERHSRVLLSVDDPYLFAVLFFAVEGCALVSVCSTPAIEPTPERTTFLGVKAVFSERSPADRTAIDWIKIGTDWLTELRLVNLPPASEPARHADDPITILLSSGTTGEVKKVLADRALIDRRMAVADNVRLWGDSRRSLCLLPFFTIGGVSSLFYALTYGGSTTYALAGEPWSEVLARRTFDAILATPAQLQQMVADLPADRQPDPTFTISVGGGAPSRALAQLLRERVTPNIYMSYASTETGVITQCHIDEVVSGAEAAGFPVPTVTVEIVGEDDRPKPAGESGVIRVAGGHIVDGYADDPNKTATNFRDGWYYPGDVGFIDAAGSLTVLGRTDDLMNLSGAKLLPSFVEDRIARAVDGVTAAVFAAIAPGDTGQSLWVASEGTMPREAIIALAPFSRYATIRLSTVDALPRNAMGKVDRAALRAAATAGTLRNRKATFELRTPATLQ